MSNSIQIKRRINGAPGAPAAGGSLEGELSLNFPGPAGSAGQPDLYAFDGTGWRHVNPPAAAPTVGTVNLPGGTPGTATGIGAAWTAFATKPTDPIIIASFAGSAYVKTGAGAVDADWTSLGSATAFAVAADVIAGTDTSKSINSAALRGGTVNTPSGGTAGVADADKIIRLNATGQIDSKFLPATPSNVRGSVDPTAALVAPTPPYASGDIVFSNTAGTVDASWTGAAGQTVASGDSLIFDGTAWHVIPNATDLNAYVPLAGATMNDGAKLTFDVTTGGSGTVVVDAAGGSIDGAVIDGGTY